MATKKNIKSQDNSSDGAGSRIQAKLSPDHPRTQLRFKSPEHHRLVVEAAKRSHRSLNAWLVLVTEEAACRELKIK